jgi:hypothetical protein
MHSPTNHPARPSNTISTSRLIVGAALLLCLLQNAQDGWQALPFGSWPRIAYLGLLARPFFWRGGERHDRGPDLQVGGYAGAAHTARSGLQLVQPNGTNLRFEGVPWRSESFRPPPYDGLRGIYWLPHSHLGIMGDFTHIKAEAILNSILEQSGIRDGQAVPATGPLWTTFRTLEFTHGFNLITLNVVRRGGLGRGNLVAYVGAGLGLAYPHVEMQRSGMPAESRTYEYQIAGPAMQVLGGLEWRFGQRLSLFVEYKLSCAAISGTLKGGGSLETNLCTHQLLAGPALHLAPRDSSANQ